MKKYIVLAIVVAAVVVYLLGRNVSGETYKTVRLEKGDITERITASGIIDPISTVSIGTQASGTIKEIYIDYNSPVKKDQVLALIDPALFEASVAQREAALAVAKAEVDVIKNDITFNKKQLDRIRKLNQAKYSADKDLDSAERDYSNSVVQLELKQALVKQAEAQLLTAQIDLNNTKIMSSVDGIVISKEVEVGQTVAASFQTPTLFTVAEDLTKMEIVASVVEADIAKVDVGQVVEFNVDSFQDEVFEGMVTQVRNNPITTQNVVTYDVIIEIDNSELRLKPGMTANVNIITAEKTGVFLVPNQALRFFIADEDATVRRYKDRGIWIMEANGKPQRVTIREGISDDENTEVISDSLKEGMNVIVGSNAANSANSSSAPMRMRL